jgi:hypothetical protein
VNVGAWFDCAGACVHVFFVIGVRFNRSPELRPTGYRTIGSALFSFYVTRCTPPAGSSKHSQVGRREELMNDSLTAVSAATPISQEAIAALIAVFAGLLGLFVQVRAKRTDDKRAAYLQRLDRQLSDLYGPLYSLFEIGDKQWKAFLDQYSATDRPSGFLGLFPHEGVIFTPPDAEQLGAFRLWMDAVFMPTNIAMEQAIISHAELLIGETIPQPFLDFCVHVAGLKASLAEWQSEIFDRTDWRKHMAVFPHPAGEFHIVVKASFEVLKKEQSKLIAGEINRIDERRLNDTITEKVRELKDEWGA